MACLLVPEKLPLRTRLNDLSENRPTFRRIHPSSFSKTFKSKNSLITPTSIASASLSWVNADEKTSFEKELDSLEEIYHLPLPELKSLASEIRDKGENSNVITFSPKVFIPLTRLCRDTCGYCTFAIGPKPGQRAYMTPQEVLSVAKSGVESGCTEALFTLGDKPELKWPQAREELEAMGYSSTLSYLAYMCELVQSETGILPHVNAGVMSDADLALLRQVSASQGLMLESTSEKVMLPGGPHHLCEDKIPSLRLAVIESAGKLSIPFTSGILIGLGESIRDRLESLLILQNLHRKYGHIQEIIVQNFRAKRGTRMGDHPEPSLEELLRTVALARIIFGGNVGVQVPPNLTPCDDGTGGDSWLALIESGISDWGGISPLTKDWVNPEAPWPHILPLGKSTAKAGKRLLARLAVYPKYIQESSVWISPEVSKKVLPLSDSEGFSRAQKWTPGCQLAPPPIKDKILDSEEKTEMTAGSFPLAVGANGMLLGESGEILHDPIPVSPLVQKIIEKALSEKALSEDEIVVLFKSRGSDFEAICTAADWLRQKVNGEKVSYVVNRNINYTNICTFSCHFCAFSKGKIENNAKDQPYLLPLEEIVRRASEAWDRGATEVCLQGGIHPSFTGETYLSIVQSIKESVPDIHIHAFSPLEISQGAKTLNISVEKFLILLKEAGLGSLPGTAAEVLDDEVRKILCPDKISSAEWTQVIKTAHKVDLPTTSTIMFGHVDSPRSWAKHLITLRNIQKETAGITEFVPLPFVHMEAPLYLRGESRKGPTMRESVLMHSIARLALHPLITNIQASWVKMGPGGAKSLLSVGCNDMGGSLMNESITRAAGAKHGQELPPLEMEKLIKAVGRVPVQRTTLYNCPPAKQIELSLNPLELRPLNK